MPTMTVQQAIDLALQHHQAGQFADAERLYRQILAEHPKQVDALHFLGIIANQTGRTDLAVEFIQRVIALCPNHAEAHSNLGHVLTRMGKFDQAVVACRRAIALRPDLAGAYSNLGIALRNLGQFDESIAAFLQAIRLDPTSPELHNNLGNALKDKQQFDEAIAAYQKAIALSPTFAEAYCNMGLALRAKGQLDDAILAYRQAATLNPGFAEALSSLGNTLREAGRVDEAIIECRRAIAIKPEYAEAHANLGRSLYDKGQWEQAIAEYRQAIAVKPQYADAHYSLAHLLLLQGDYLQGWAENEWRWRVSDPVSPWPGFAQPQWDGRDVADGVLLLHAEQGFGDTLQFIRYLPLVFARCKKVIVQCPAALVRLLQSSFPEAPCIAPGELPQFDVHCPLLSLPLALGTTLQTIPNAVPYVHADADARERWRDRLANDPAGLRIGLVWAGSTAHKNDRDRSLPLSTLAPLTEAPGVTFYSLQKGDAAHQIRLSPFGVKLIDWTQQLDNFAETAALIANLDLVISVDTAVAHLAGAMGKPVWILLPHIPDWRWLLDRQDSPWYPTMRLFRQTKAGDWDGVVRRVVDVIEALTRDCRPADSASKFARYSSSRGESAPELIRRCSQT